MKNSLWSVVRLLPVLVCVAVSAVAVRAADVFEGRVQMTFVESKRGQTTQMTYAMKDGKIRMEMPTDGKGKGMMPGGAMIMDPAKKEIYVLMDSPEMGGKIYMKQGIKDDAGKAAKKGEAEPTLTASGKTEKILGYVATEFISTTSNGETSSIWLAKGLGSFLFASPDAGGKGGKSPAWANLLKDGVGFPLRVVVNDKQGKESSRMEVTNIEKATLPASLFSLDGYQEFKMPSFGGFGRE